jgi:Xaa-Pro dipeptidase
MLVRAVSEAVLGRRMSAGALWQRVKPRIWAVIGVSLLSILIPFVAFLVVAGVFTALGFALVAAGMVEPWALALVGASASLPHGSRQDRAVAPGDVVLVDTGASLHGYRSDITRTWVVGEPDAAVRRAWQTVAAAQQAAFAASRPGVRTGAVDAAARAVMAEAGYGADDRYFTHRLGHGIGLEVHEPPYLVGGGTTELVPGMTMSNEPGIYVPGSFGVRLEDIVLVTRDGVDVFGPPVGPALDVRPTG